MAQIHIFHRSQSDWHPVRNHRFVIPAVWVVLLAFGAVLGVGLLSQSGGLTGQATGSGIPVTSGTILSVIAAVLAIGVLIVAGLQQNKK